MQQDSNNDIGNYFFKDFDPSYIKELAKKNNFKYTEKIKSHDIESGVYNNPNTNTYEIHKLDMLIDNFPCEYYTASYRPLLLPEYADKSNFLIQVFTVTLPYDIESLYVESRTNISLNNILGLSSILFENSETVRLEGDFNYFFRVHSLKNQEITAFTILAPNIMVRMLEQGSNYDFEFAKNKIYFYQTFSGNINNAIPLKKKVYDELLSFGIESARFMARAAKPTKSKKDLSQKAIWQLYNKNSQKTVMTFWLTFTALGLLSLTIVVPILWPIAIILIIIIFIKYQFLKLKRNRLVKRWGNNYQNLNLIKK